LTCRWAAVTRIRVATCSQRDSCAGCFCEISSRVKNLFVPLMARTLLQQVRKLVGFLHPGGRGLFVVVKRLHSKRKSASPSRGAIAGQRRPLREPGTLSPAYHVAHMDSDYTGPPNFPTVPGTVYDLPPKSGTAVFDFDVWNRRVTTGAVSRKDRRPPLPATGVLHWPPSRQRPQEYPPAICVRSVRSIPPSASGPGRLAYNYQLSAPGSGAPPFGQARGVSAHGPVTHASNPSPQSNTTGRTP